MFYFIYFNLLHYLISLYILHTICKLYKVHLTKKDSDGVLAHVTWTSQSALSWTDKAVNEYCGILGNRRKTTRRIRLRERQPAKCKAVIKANAENESTLGLLCRSAVFSINMRL